MAATKEGSKATKELKPKRRRKVKYDSCCIAKCADIAANPNSIYSLLFVLYSRLTDLPEQ
jgi:hypothetical protein